MAAATAPATTSSTVSPDSEFAAWEEEEEEEEVSPRSRSRSRTRAARRDSQRAHRISPQRIKARPAQPAVINSILDSLDTLGPLPVVPADDRFSDTESRASRPRSAYSAVSRAPSTSPGFGVEYGSRPALDDDDEDGVTDAALPPTIRTSRPPSGLSQYPGSRQPSASPAKKSTRALSRRSSRSSLTAGRSVIGSNKLSAASWVTQNSMSQETFETKRSSRSRDSRTTRRSLRRIESQESLRTSRSRTEIRFVPPAPGDEAADPPPNINISRAEQIIAKGGTPSASKSKRRLFLTDDGSEEAVQEKEPNDVPDMRSASPPPIKRGSDASVLTEADAAKSPQRVSPLNNPIVDSIPMRTSSLRHHSSSPKRGKKKDKKSKRQSIKGAKIDSKTNSLNAESKNERIPEDSWADLGEDDETVRRIRELREQRKSRLMDSRVPSMPDGLSAGATAGANQEPLPAKIETLEEEAESAGRQLTSEPVENEANKRTASRKTRPPPNRAATIDTPSKALKVLGITEERKSSAAVAFDDTPPVSRSPPDLTRTRAWSLDQSRVALRPGTALSSNSTTITPPLSLDYSYAQAVDVLQGTEGEIRRREQQASMKSSPLKTTYLDLVSADTPLRKASAPVARKSSTKRKQDRWTLHHPDLPLDAEKKRNRRKSTSDARLGRDKEESGEPLQRRDSVDAAVLAYLQNERLSRKLRHPQTGRVISFSEVGDPSGAAVFVCLGMGLTRYVTAFYDELATTLRLRLITIDRPGVGCSEPYPPNDRSGPLSWPGDVMAICQHLGIQSFSLLAHSAGAIYALASALILPHMIQGKVHLLAPWIPPSQLHAVSHSAATAGTPPPPAAALPRSQRFLRVLPTPFLKAANSSFMTATSASLKPTTKRNKTHAAKLETIHQNTVSDYPTARAGNAARPSTSDGHARPDFNRRESMMLMDQFMPSINPMENFPIAASQTGESPPTRRSSLLMSATATPMDPSFEYASAALDAAEHEARQRRDEFTSRLTQSTWELATKDSNPARDLLVCLERHRDVGFRYTDVGRAVVITHGSEDKRVPVANVRWLADQMNRRPGVLEGEEGMGCEVRVLEGEGHGLMASPLIMGDVLTEIAGYWSTSKRLTLGL